MLVSSLPSFPQNKHALEKSECLLVLLKAFSLRLCVHMRTCVSALSEVPVEEVCVRISACKCHVCGGCMSAALG